MSLRKLTVSLTALGCAGLLGCGSGSDSAVAPALPPASVTSSASAESTPPTAPSVPTIPPVPSVNSGAPRAPTAPPAPGNPTGAPQPGATTTAPRPPVAQPNQPTQPTQPTQPNQPAAPQQPGAPLPQVGSPDPSKAAAEAGPKGQTYLKALHDGGVPGDSQLDDIYILFAKATCQAKQRGDSRDSILAQFDKVGTTLAPGTGMAPRQVSELFVSTAERTFC